MKALIVLVFALGVGITAWGDPPLDSPERILERARTSRIEWRNVLVELSLAMDRIDHRDLAEKYFSLLDPLMASYQVQPLDNEAERLLRDVGNKMAMTRARWIDPMGEEASSLLALHRWMSPHSVLIFQHELSEAVRREADTERMKSGAMNLETLRDWARTNYPNLILLQIRYEQTLSDLALRLLRKSDLTDPNSAIWLQKITSAEALTEVLKDHLSHLAALKSDQREQIPRLMDRFFQIHNHIVDLGAQVSSTVRDLCGEAGRLLLMKGLQTEYKFPDGSIAQILSGLSPSHLQSLAESLTQTDEQISDRYLSDFFNAIFAVVAALDSSGLGKSAASVRSFSWSLHLKRQPAAAEIEGTYSLTDRAGKKWVFTLARVRESQYFAALADADGFVHKSFTNILQDPKSRDFHASERDADTDAIPNWILRFQIDDQGSMTLIDPLGDTTRQPLKGSRIEVYPNYFATKSGTVTNPQGHYRGALRLNGQNPTNVDLMVSAFPNYTLGRLTVGEKFFLSMNVGSRGAQGALYLTTGRLWRRTWTQLRGKVTSDGFRGVLIIGGVGLVHNFELKKQRSE